MPDVITAMTPLDALERAFDRAATYNERSRVAPAAILWPDEKEEWTRLLPRLRERFPQLLTFGDYDPETKTGPAIWMKCMVARTLEARVGLTGTSDELFAYGLRPYYPCTGARPRLQGNCWE